MALETYKLIRVTDGLYRDQYGTYIGKQFPWRNEPAHWLVRFTNGYGSRVEKKFPTLALVRHYLATGEDRS